MPALESQVQHFLDSHPRPTTDILGDFLDLDGDIADVATNVNDHLTDPRLADVHPESLFKILLLATQQGTLDRERFIPFLISLLDRDPQKAVPLSLLLDFEQLTASQRNDVFQCREIHELAMGYFLAASMSLARDNAAKDLASVIRKLKGKIKSIQKAGSVRQSDGLKKFNEDSERELNELKEISARQKKQIAELTEIKVARKKALKEGKAVFEKQLTELREELARQKELAKQKRDEVEARRTRLLSEIEGGVAAFRTDIENRLEDEGKKNAARRREDENEWENAAELGRENVREEEIAMENLTEQTVEVKRNIAEWRAVFAGKIIRDRIRTDNWMRETEKRFEEFAKLGVWEIDEDQLREAEIMLDKLEQKRIRRG
jgi:hypothetical protein